MSTSIADGVRIALTRLCRENDLFHEDIRPEHSITEDLGVDSILLVDLTVLLQRETGIVGLPVLRWADQESSRVGQRFTVGSLVAAMEQVAAAPRASK